MMELISCECAPDLCIRSGPPPKVLVIAVTPCLQQGINYLKITYASRQSPF